MAMSDAATANAASAGGWLDDIVAGLVGYYLTTLPVVLGVWFGMNFLERGAPSDDPVAACVRFDAIHYVDIIRDGFYYDPTRRSTVAQFPAYPLVTRWLCKATGLAPEEGGLLSANLFLIGAFILLARWVRVRWPEATADQRTFVLAVFGLWPMGLFFRMPYAESLFLLGTLMALYGMARRWPLVALALVTGFVTAVRPFGVAVTAAFVWHALMQPGSGLWVKIARSVVLLPVASWGLLAFIAYQWQAFHAPLGFVQTQEHWSIAIPEDQSWHAKAVSLLTLEPIRGVYDPTSPRYWGNIETRGGALLNIMFWNPILFLLAATLVALGRGRRWLMGSELVFGGGLLAIPYLTRAYEMSMASHARFGAVVVVNYLVIGRMAAGAGTSLRIAVCAGLGIFLFMFASLYASHHLVF
jgi:hypothetical protein